MIVKMTCSLIAALISLAVSAQKKTKFRFINMAGIVAGKSGSYQTLQSVNGLNYKEWFAGIGAGIDYYKYKSIPVFFDLRTSVAKTNFFVFADLGYNFPLHNKPGKEIYYYNTYNFSGGFYNETGAGFKVKLNRRSHLLFTSGYSYKKLNNKVGVINPCLIAPCPIEYSTYEYGYGRIVFKAGVSL